MKIKNQKFFRQRQNKVFFVEIEQKFCVSNIDNKSKVVVELVAVKKTDSLPFHLNCLRICSLQFNERQTAKREKKERQNWFASRKCILNFFGHLQAFYLLLRRAQRKVGEDKRVRGRFFTTFISTLSQAVRVDASVN